MRIDKTGKRDKSAAIEDSGDVAIIVKIATNAHDLSRIVNKNLSTLQHYYIAHCMRAMRRAKAERSVEFANILEELHDAKMVSLFRTRTEERITRSKACGQPETQYGRGANTLGSNNRDARLQENVKHHWAELADGGFLECDRSDPKHSLWCVVDHGG
jgi:hypothetical protein